LVYVIIAPPEPDKNITVDQVASVINKDVFSTRLLLAGKVPKIVARNESAKDADVIANNLRALGLKAIVCPDNELHQPLRNFKVERLQFGREEIVFSNKENKTVKVESGDALLIVTGRVDIPESREVKSTKSKLNLPATLLTGGIPIHRKVTETTIQTEMRTERFVKIYSKKTGDSSIEIRQHEFDYSCLSSHPVSASIILFKDLTAKIRDVFTKAVFDDKLTGNYGSILPDVSPWENIDILCRLIYLFVQRLP
jgi:hypothetical protein